MPTRRDFLKLAAMLSGAATLASESIQRAYAIEPAPGSTFVDAEHIVILMQENRSFDHAYGTLRGVRGFNDPRALRQPNGNSVFVQTDAAGNSYAPWRMDIQDTRVTWMGSLPHSRESQIDAWNQGHHDGWLEAKRSGDKQYAHLPLTMGHYTRQDLPFYYALADAFTVCDQNYCSVLTSTSPNRSYFWTGTIRERQHPEANAHIRNEQIDDGGMTWKTFPERLHEAGIHWKHYQNELTRSGLQNVHDAWLSNFGDNVLECFAAYNVEAYPGFAPALKQWIADQSADIDRIQKHLAGETNPAKAADSRKQIQAGQTRLATFQSWLANSGEARYNQLTPEQKALHHAAFVTNSQDPAYHDLEPLAYEDQGKTHTMQVPKGDVFYQFRKDVNEGKLPTVSWLTAPEKFSDHPTAPWYGAWYVSEVMDILTKNPEVWKKTIFILTYDENDGYFDHAPSYVAADPKRPETGGASAGIDTALEYLYKEDELRMGVDPADARTGPIGMGFRVPMVVASPWSRGGWVNSQLFDHTSTLMFLESFLQAKFGKTVREQNISPWRRAVSGDLTSVFRPFDPSEPSLQSLDRDQFCVSIERARFKEIPANIQPLSPEQIHRINRQINPSPLQSAAHSLQEPGQRPACALPYELYADGNLSPDGTHFELRLSALNQVHGTKSSGAAFNVYLRNLAQSGPSAGPNTSPVQSATYAVKPGDTLTRQIPLSLFAQASYAIEVHAANGFYRCFTSQSTSQSTAQAAAPANAGPAALNPLQIRANYHRQGDQLTGNLQLDLHNPTHTPIQITIQSNHYQPETVAKSLNPGEQASIVLDLSASHGWYDFTVQSNHSTQIHHYAGHVETGKPTLSDPLMAGLV